LGTEAKLAPARLLAFSGPSFVLGALGIPLGVYLPAYYSGHLGLDLAKVGITFALVRIVAIAFDPVVGVALDATRTRHGRFRPWIVASAPVLMAATFFVFMARPGISIPQVVASQLLLYFGLSMSGMATSAWGAALAPGYHERSRLYGWVQMLGFGGALVCLLLPPILGSLGEVNEASVVHAMGWLILLTAPLNAALAVLFVAEPVANDPMQQRIGYREYLTLIKRPAMLRMLGADLFLSVAPSLTGTLYFFFFHAARGYSFADATKLLLVFIVSGLFMPLWAYVTRWIGKHRAVMLAAFINAIGQCILIILPSQSFWLMAIAMFLVGFVANSYGLLMSAMLADVSDEVKLDTGNDRTAPLFALMSVFAKVGAAIPLAITFPVLKYVGFNPVPGAANTPAAIHGLEACFVAAPVVATALGGLCLWGYHLTASRHEVIRTELDARDALALASGGDLSAALDPATHVPVPIEIDAPD
jgi:Na+/melibiose symporter-like transporter